MSRAAKAAENVDGKWRVGCVIVRGGRVLSIAVNTLKNIPANCQDRLWCSSEHAEAAALRMVADPKGATAYVARIGRNGAMRHAQPCVRCQELLDKAGVNVIWSSDPAYVKQRDGVFVD